MYASNRHSYTHLILALGIVREPTVWVFIASKYPDTHDIGRASVMVIQARRPALTKVTNRVNCSRTFAHPGDNTCSKFMSGSAQQVAELKRTGTQPDTAVLVSNRPLRKLILAGYCFGLSRQCLIMHDKDKETLWGCIYEALPGQYP